MPIRKTEYTLQRCRECQGGKFDQPVEFSVTTFHIPQEIHQQLTPTPPGDTESRHCWIANKENALKAKARMETLLRELSEGDLERWPDTKEEDIPKISEGLNVRLAVAKMWLKLLGD